jgi:hypothetical protein
MHCFPDSGPQLRPAVRWPRTPRANRKGANAVSGAPETISLAREERFDLLDFPADMRELSKLNYPFAGQALLAVAVDQRRRQVIRKPRRDGDKRLDGSAFVPPLETDHDRKTIHLAAGLEGASVRVACGRQFSACPEEHPIRQRFL